jgi:hypothetical protein
MTDTLRPIRRLPIRARHLSDVLNVRYIAHIALDDGANVIQKPFFGDVPVAYVQSPLDSLPQRPAR